jgi:DNA polymerase III epsilon subunit-like protein
MSIPIWLLQAMNKAHNEALNTFTGTLLQEYQNNPSKPNTPSMESINHAVNKHVAQYSMSLNKILEIHANPIVQLSTPPSSQEHKKRKLDDSKDLEDTIWINRCKDLGKVIILDLETTGLDIKKDRIVQIGMIIVDGNSCNKMEYLINPLMDINPAATKVHKITNAMVKNSPTFKWIADTIRKSCKDAIVIGYNLHQFDIPMLDQEFARINCSQLQFDFSIDVAQVCWKNFKKDLTSMHKFFMGYERKAHNALNDCISTANIFSAIISETKWSSFPTRKCELASFLEEEDNKGQWNGKIVQIRDW